MRFDLGRLRPSYRLHRARETLRFGAQGVGQAVEPGKFGTADLALGGPNVSTTTEIGARSSRTNPVQTGRGEQGSGVTDFRLLLNRQTLTATARITGLRGSDS